MSYFGDELYFKEKKTQLNVLKVIIWTQSRSRRGQKYDCEDFPQATWRIGKTSIKKTGNIVSYFGVQIKFYWGR